MNRLAVASIFLVIVVQGVKASSLLDPTRPPGITYQQRVSVIKKQTLWRLSSTLISSNRKSATINGKLVRQGDSINGAKIIDIQAWDVTLKRNNKKFKVYMFNRKLYKKFPG